MARKNVAVRDEVYRKLSEAREEGESFSDLIERLLERRTSHRPLWGSLCRSTALQEVEAETRAIRKSATIRL
jgi:predicted CopG family antitoxin